MTDIGQELISAVRKAAAEAPERVYDRTFGCRYVLNGQPSCLVGHALWNLKLIGPGLEPQYYNSSDINELSHHLGLSIDPLDMEWLEVVQDRQDSGLSWVAAVQAADDFNHELLASW